MLFFSNGEHQSIFVLLLNNFSINVN